MQLSIIIVSFNIRDLLYACLGSLMTNYADKFQKNIFEIIIVDNASSDLNTDLLQKDFPQVRILTNSKNVGFAKANNIGIKHAQGGTILLLNPDTVVPVGTLTTMVDYMNKNPQAAIATCKVLLASGELDDACHRGFPTPQRALFHFSGLAKIFPHSTFFNGYHLGYQMMDKIHEIDACAGAFLMIKKSVGERVDWLDEDYFWYGDDLDLCYRVKQAGFKVMYVPDVSIVHYKGASSGIKKHSQHVSVADAETKLLATKARFEVMRTFYKKHYINSYPRLLTSLVFFGITIREKIAEITL